MNRRLRRLAEKALVEATAAFLDWHRDAARMVVPGVMARAVEDAWQRGEDPDAALFEFVAVEIRRMKRQTQA